jgi:hypothetical protein
VCARRERIGDYDARGMVVCVLQVSALEERIAQAEPGCFIARVFGQELSKELFRQLEIAFAQRALRTASRFTIGTNGSRSSCERKEKNRDGENEGCDFFDVRRVLRCQA